MTHTMAIALLDVAKNGSLPIGRIPRGTADALLSRRVVVIDGDESDQCARLVLTERGKRRVGMALIALEGCVR